MNPFFSTVSTTLQLQAPFTALMALIVYRVWSAYRVRPMRDLAIGWSLWTGRMVVVSYAAALRSMGELPSSPTRRVASALGVGLVLAALPYLVRGTLSLARGDDSAPSPHRLSVLLAVGSMLVSLLVTQPGAPDSWRLATLVFSSTISFSVAFGFVTWQLLRIPADELTTGRQLAAFGFGAYAVKQLWNVHAFLRQGPPEASASAIAENIALITVALGSVALLFDRLRQREVRAERERHRLEAELAAREHLESLGRLAGGVAHDFNNMLTAILVSAQLARDETLDRTGLTEELNAIESTASRASTLTRQLLTFARREPVQLEAFDAAERIRQVQRYVERQLPAGVTLEVDLPLLPIVTRADPSRFDQVAINLILNARDALNNEEGHVRVSLSQARGAVDGADAILLSVKDNGMGMDAATQARIFEPFFTTKGRDRGTGLGLSIVHGAVSQAGGTIAVQSQPGQGTQFDILFPMEPRAEAVPSTGAREGHVQKAAPVG
jgi:signal transduction histidine kinase